ncbi:hypothetical protein [Salmonirosea aquatica]|uniref:Uncharacterized protein n=1 Tax=Salmonirosea aquatica TaxID=2654236 RepID=A0A7C9FYR0_9BACT|nr:hypothetical protein [Cytophagaceae bacterium SJW1-29]
MKKVSILFFVLFAGVALRGISQTTTPADFFAGKWEILVSGTPNGDVTLVTDLVRKEGKLTGELSSPTDPNVKFPITKVEESADKLSIYFDSSQAGEIAINLTKVDDDNLKGVLMDSFETKAKRVKE